MSNHIFEGRITGPVCYCVPNAIGACATCRAERQEKEDHPALDARFGPAAPGRDAMPRIWIERFLGARKKAIAEGWPRGADVAEQEAINNCYIYGQGAVLITPDGECRSVDHLINPHLLRPGIQPDLDGDCRFLGCDGTYTEKHHSDGGCSCHLAPPCSWCTETTLICSECGDEPE